MRRRLSEIRQPMFLEEGPEEAMLCASQASARDEYTMMRRRASTLIAHGDVVYYN